MLNHSAYGSLQIGPDALGHTRRYVCKDKLFDLVVDNLCLVCLAGSALRQIVNRLVRILNTFGNMPKFLTEFFAAFVKRFSGMYNTA